MKRLKNSLIGLTILGATSLATSCLDDAENNYSQLTIGTIKVIEGNDYYFKLDPGSKMYPGDTTHIVNYPLKDGQRAFVYFDLLDEKITGYDYNAIIYRIEDILTKDILRIPSEETEENIGNDRINITNLWIANGYINIQYQLFYNENSDKKHLLNLVVNEQKASDSQEYLTLEFRHNAFKEEERKLGAGLVSFRLDKIAENIKNKKGIKVKYQSLYEGTTHKQADFE